MTDSKITYKDFPTLDDEQNVLWAPIIFRPNEGSWERFVVGLVAKTSSDYHIEPANELSRLNCLYGSNAKSALLAIEIAVSEIESVLSNEPEFDLNRLDCPVSSVKLGKVQETRGASAQEVAISWLDHLSSFYNRQRRFDVKIMYDEIAEELKPERVRTPIRVYDFISSVDVNLLEYFHENVRLRRKRRVRGNARLMIDFSGKRLLANIERFKIDAPTSSVGTIKQRLWDLSVKRDENKGKSFKQHEMLVLLPNLEIEMSSDRKQDSINAAIEMLQDQADTEEIRLRNMDSIREIGKHIVEVEKAA